MTKQKYHVILFGNIEGLMNFFPVILSEAKNYRKVERDQAENRQPVLLRPLAALSMTALGCLLLRCRFSP